MKKVREWISTICIFACIGIIAELAFLRFVPIEYQGKYNSVTATKEYYTLWSQIELLFDKEINRNFDVLGMNSLSCKNINWVSTNSYVEGFWTTTKGMDNKPRPCPYYWPNEIANCKFKSKLFVIHLPYGIIREIWKVENNILFR